MSAKLYVGNLSFQTTREQLLALFGTAGHIVDAVIPTDRESGRSRGFAFVEFSTDAEAKEGILRFNGFEHDGRALRVNEAEDRPQRPRVYSPSDDGGGTFFGDSRARPRPKGSRRNLRAHKRGG